MDSGSFDCLVDAKIGRGRIFLPIRSLPDSHPVITLDGRPLGRGLISEVTDMLSMSIEIGGHSERIRFFLVDSPSFPHCIGARVAP